MEKSLGLSLPVAVQRKWRMKRFDERETGWGLRCPKAATTVVVVVVVDRMKDEMSAVLADEQLLKDSGKIRDDGVGKGSSCTKPTLLTGPFFRGV